MPEAAVLAICLRWRRKATLAFGLFKSAAAHKKRGGVTSVDNPFVLKKSFPSF